MSNLALKRGSACVLCRMRKVRCDGIRPSCGPCSRRGDDCQFAGEPSQIQQLEQQIDCLRNRLEQLESSSGPNSAQSSSSGSPLTPLSPSSPSAAVLVDGWWNFDEPPIPVRRILLDVFISLSCSFGFFLNIPRFIESFNKPAPIGHPSRPSPALLNAIYLWGIFLSPDKAMKPYELVFLARAIHNTQQALLGDHPQKEIHAIQAELLLSFYFFQTGHMCEGLAHSNAAAIIVIAYRFHKIRALQSPFAACVGVDSVQEGELINACWASYLVDKSWTAIVPNSVSAFSDEDNEDDRIDSPWPLDMAQYEADQLQPYGQGTVQRFLQDSSESFAIEDSSFFAMHCKAATLFERATSLGSEITANRHHEDTIYTEVLSLNQRIERFYSSISPLVPRASYLGATKALIIVHTLTLGAIINLNLAYSQQDSTWSTKCVDSALSTVTILDGMDLERIGYLNPIVGNLWLQAGMVLIRELVHLQALRSAVLSASSREIAIRTALDKLVEIMTEFGSRSPNISSQCIALINAM